MGQVWAARLHGTRGFQKLVAVKTILPSNEDAGHLEAMLFEEASLASLVRHTNVIETLDLGERDDGTLYLVMEWVAGEPLDFIMRTARLTGGVPLPMLVNFALQGLRGLQAVHEARDPRGEPLGIVHRDVSLQNLLVTYEGVVKLIDFGIAKATQQMSKPTEEGLIKGKFGYMSPEQLRSEPLDAKADLFGLGVVLYRATTGVHPFHGDNMAATIRNILMKEPKRPTEIDPSYPPALEDVVLKALAKDKAARFGSAHEMMLALEAALPDARRPLLERQAAGFLQHLFKERIAERTRAIQAALKSADGGLAEKVKAGEVGPFPRSQPTMRAVSREVTGNSVESPVLIAGAATTESDDSSAPARDEPGRWSRAIRALGAAGVIGALIAAGMILPRLSTGKAATESSRSSPANAQLPQLTIRAPSVPRVDIATDPSPAPVPPPLPVASAPASAAASAPQGAAAHPPSAVIPPGARKHTARPNEANAAPPASSATAAAPAAAVVESPGVVDPLSRRK